MKEHLSMGHTAGLPQGCRGELTPPEDTRLPDAVQDLQATCRSCVRLLFDYAAAANQVIDIKRGSAPPSDLLTGAKAKQADVRRRLATHQRSLCWNSHCPNNQH
jgi:hypothetical protein